VPKNAPRVAKPTMIGLAGLAELLGVSDARAGEVARTKHFPAAVDDEGEPKWDLELVQRWILIDGRRANSYAHYRSDVSSPDVRPRFCFCGSAVVGTKTEAGETIRACSSLLGEIEQRR
jgi:hypothetical protein